MALGINTNVASLSAQNELSSSKNTKNEALERLSSGLRINSAKDDAAGLAISTRFEAQINGLDQAVRNANDGISLAQTAEGALGETVNSLQRIRELSVQSANDTNSTSDRASLQEEVDQLTQEINRIADTTQFNGLDVLNGDFTGQKFQVGANSGQTIGVSVDSARANEIGNNVLSSDGTGTTASAAADSVPTSDVTNAEDLTITGDAGTATVGVGAGNSAKEVADAVNAETGSTGVTAEATSKARIENVQNTGSVSFDLTGADGTAVTVQAQIDDTNNLSGLSDAINAKSGTTGISAELNSSRDKITLTSAEGDDIQIADASNSDGTDNNVFDVQGLTADGSTSGSAQTLADADSSGTGATDSTRVTGQLEFSSDESFSVTAGATGGLFGSTSNSSGLDSVDQIDITTQSGASDAIKTIDGALDRINSQRATLGAVQSRFESTISNLETTSQNLSAANGRIVDADFAAETAKLQKANVLQQAGISVLAQANQSPQQVLSLLQ